MIGHILTENMSDDHNNVLGYGPVHDYLSHFVYKRIIF